jgi:hypothetical protein
MPSNVTAAALVRAPCRSSALLLHGHGCRLSMLRPAPYRRMSWHELGVEGMVGQCRSSPDAQEQDNSGQYRFHAVHLQQDKKGHATDAP